MDDGRLVQVVGLGQARKNKGAAGLNSRGTADERKQWSLRLHLAKARKARYRDELYTLDLLSSLQRVSKSDRKIRIKRDRQGKIVGSQGLIKTASSFKLLLATIGNLARGLWGATLRGWPWVRVLPQWPACVLCAWVPLWPSRPTRWLRSTAFA